ncbi:uncharacterized protein BDV14DRAFT_176041 [Aspergillus stella-maris]|uniref:uncharacterized protein n=1 Tax=Aspergillus stella-maris TaxID=1810926 RepID=UPI003CCD89C2
MIRNTIRIVKVLSVRELRKAFSNRPLTRCWSTQLITGVTIFLWPIFLLMMKYCLQR